MRNNPQQRHLVATAGSENPLRLWTLERLTVPIFTAKNVGYNIQQCLLNDKLLLIVMSFWKYNLCYSH